MKKTLLVSTVLLFSVVTFAQTTVKNSEAIKDKTTIQSNEGGSQVNNSVNATSATDIHSNAANNAEGKSYAQIKKESQQAAATKQTMVIQAKEKTEKSEKIASKDRTVSASTRSNTKVNASAGDNNFSNNTSLNNGASVSTTHLQNKGNQIKNDGKAMVAAKTNATLENGNHVAAHVNKTAVKGSEKINTTSTAAVHSGATSVQVIKPRPASIKMNTMVKTNAGIRIK